MFQIGDFVMYAGTGVCGVTDRREEKFGPVRQEYYVLQPVRDRSSTFYCPVAQAENRLRPLISSAELETLIRQIPAAPVYDIADDMQRKELLGHLAKAGTQQQRIQVIKTLWLYRNERQAGGKRLHLADERILNEAERLLNEEFAQVLQIEPEAVPAYIAAQISEVESGKIV